MRHPTRIPFTAMTAAFVLAALVAPPSVNASVSAVSAGDVSSASAIGPTRVPTKFALGATGFGSRLVGGRVPTSSDATAFQSIGCTNFAGADKNNFIDEVEVPGLGTASGVKTRVWTEKVGTTVSSYSTQAIAKLTLEGEPGVLDIRGIQSMSHAFNQGGQFKARTEGSVARITLTPQGGSPQELDIPTPDQAIEIPGLARIAIGNVNKKVTAAGARAAANVLQIEVFPTDTVSRVAQTIARIDGGITQGVFSGFSSGLTGRGLEDNVRVGRVPLSIMPCQGTNGQAKVKDTGRVEVGNGILARGVASGQIGTQTRSRTFGTERGQAAQVVLGGGRVEINGIIGVVNVSRTSDDFARNIRGTKVLEVVVDGERRSFPNSGVIEIPGLVRLENTIRTRLKNGLEVVALRITLLDGSGAVVDVGIAKLEIRPSRLG